MNEGKYLPLRHRDWTLHMDAGANQQLAQPSKSTILFQEVQAVGLTLSKPDRLKRRAACFRTLLPGTFPLSLVIQVLSFSRCPQSFGGGCGLRDEGELGEDAGDLQRLIAGAGSDLHMVQGRRKRGSCPSATQLLLNFSYSKNPLFPRNRFSNHFFSMKMAELGPNVLESCIIDFDDIQLCLTQFCLNLNICKFMTIFFKFWPKKIRKTVTVADIEIQAKLS